MTGAEYRVLFEGRDYPIFQNRMYDSAEDARTCPRGQIELVQDMGTGLIRNRLFDPTLMEYDAAYQNEQGNSAPFRAHLDVTRDRVLHHFGTEALVEIGCGKGGFLNMLAAAGADITGYDPTFEGEDPRIEKRYFGPGIGVRAKGIVLRHVLEHIADPVAFLRMIAEANGGGPIYIEVPCFDWIARKRAWFDIFYEHANYFRLSDFHRIFGHVIEAGHCFGGQYLGVFADLASLRDPVFRPDDAVTLPTDFAIDLDFAGAGPQDVVWGGASKGVIYALARHRAGLPVAHVVDINPGKQGRYLAGTGLRVEAPHEVLPRLGQNARILIMNPNYAGEIKEMAGDRFTFVEVGQ